MKLEWKEGITMPVSVLISTVLFICSIILLHRCEGFVTWSHLWVMCKSREPRNDANVGTELFSLSMTMAEDGECILLRYQG